MKYWTEILVSLVLQSTLISSEYLSRQLKECNATDGVLSFDCDTMCDNLSFKQPGCVISPNRSVCTKETSILLTEDGLCPDPTGERGCTYLCYEASQNTKFANVFRFFIPFNKTLSDPYQETLNSLPDDREGFPWQNNQYLTSIEVLKVPTQFTSVDIIGGSSYDRIRGVVAKLDIAPRFVEDSPWVRDLRFFSLDFRRMDDYTDILSNQIQGLRISNCLISSIPSKIVNYPLDILELSIGYIDAVPKEVSMDTMKTLILSSNKLRSFEANYPKLQSLELQANELEEIPSVIYTFQNLKLLNMSFNPLKSGAFTQEQYDFLARLETLSLPTFSDPLPCTNTLYLGGSYVCVGEDDDGNTTGACFGHSCISIVLIIAGVIVVLFLLAIACWKFKWITYGARKNTAQGTGTGTAASTHTNYLLESDARLNPQQSIYSQSVASSIPNPQQSIYSQSVVSSLPSDVYVMPAVKNSSYGRPSHTGTDMSTEHRFSLWTDSDLLSYQLAYDDIKDINILGSGSYGVVWLVSYRGSQMLASKRLQDGASGDRAKTADFIQEIKIVAKLQHPNITKFIGVAWTVESNLQALFEFMDNGDLRSYIQEGKLENTWSDVHLSIAADIIEGLIYVHSFNPPLLHRDLKSRNVLLTRSIQAKLCDFGISRYQSRDGTMTAGVGTGKWLAPEVILGSQDYGTSCDIFSFGVVLSELDTHNLPYEELKGQMNDFAIYQKIAHGQLKPTFNSSCPPEVLQLAEQCLSFNPSQRPTAIQIAYMLRKIRQSAPKDEELTVYM